MFTRVYFETTYIEDDSVVLAILSFEELQELDPSSIVRIMYLDFSLEWEKHILCKTDDELGVLEFVTPEELASHNYEKVKPDSKEFNEFFRKSREFTEEELAYIKECKAALHNRQKQHNRHFLNASITSLVSSIISFLVGILLLMSSMV